MYDPSIVNRVLPESLRISTELAHRLPVAMVLIQGLICLFITLRMVEPKKVRDESMWKSCLKAVGLTMQTAKWVFTNPNTLVFVVVGLSIDSVVRNLATITSSYYRLIELPEWSFGFIGAAIGVGGYIVPGIAAKLNRRDGTYCNLVRAAALSLIGLTGIVSASGWWNLLPAALLMMTMGFLSFTLSRALNRESDSAKRATVLSVKGLAFNLGYGSFSLAFSLFLASNSGASEDEAFRLALLWQIPFFAIVTGSLLLWGKKRSMVLRNDTTI